MGSCNLHNPGVSPPEAALSYPSALALSSHPDGGTPRFLYVANSNFDLRYNAGSIHSYDLAALDQVLENSGCLSYGALPGADGGTLALDDNTVYAPRGLLDAGVPDASDADAGVPADAGLALGLDAGKILVPANYGNRSAYGNPRGFLCDGRDPVGGGNLPDYTGCCFDKEAKLDKIRNSWVEIDSFAVGVAVAPDNGRVYVPVSSRNQLLYLDVDGNGNMSCGDDTGRCRRGPDRESPDHVADDKFPGQLSEITIGTLGDLYPKDQTGIDLNQVYMATTHERGAVGLFVVQSDPSDGVLKPRLDGVVRGLGQRPRSVIADPSQNLLYVTSAGEPYISRVGARVSFEKAEDVEPPRQILYESSRITVTGVSQANDLRDLAFDPKHPTRLYALIRGTQESVVFIDVDSTLPQSNARVVKEVRVGAGPSKMIRIDQDGKSFLLVSCYDSKSVYAIDVETGLFVAEVRSFSGPFAMAYDESRKLLHVADFRASIMRVVDLAGLTDSNLPPPRIVATIGSPQFEGALQ